jgi:hypothetical protein
MKMEHIFQSDDLVVQKHGFLFLEFSFSPNPQGTRFNACGNDEHFSGGCLRGLRCEHSNIPLKGISAKPSGQLN